MDKNLPIYVSFGFNMKFNNSNLKENLTDSKISQQIKQPIS